MGGGGGSFRGKQKDLNYFVGNFVVIFFFFFFLKFFMNTKFTFPGSISTADGSALVKLGNTTVICGVKAVGFLYACNV